MRAEAKIKHWRELNRELKLYLDLFFHHWITVEDAVIYPQTNETSRNRWHPSNLIRPLSGKRAPTRERLPVSDVVSIFYLKKMIDELASKGDKLWKTEVEVDEKLKRRYDKMESEFTNLLYDTTKIPPRIRQLKKELNDRL